jgi:cytochrome c oxidase subunit 2
MAIALLRRRRAPAEPLMIDAARQRRMSAVVTLAVGLTVVVISIFTLGSFFATRPLAGPSDAITIEVRGFQWWWNVSYLDEHGTALFAAANEIHVPVGRAVRLHLGAADVIHSFWVPSLAGKQDLIPGRDNTLIFTALRPGVYRGQCAEFCGLQHAHMALDVVAHEAAEFEAWRSRQQQNAAAPADDEQRAGQQVFMAKACSACHAVRGTAAAGALGPDLTHVGSRRTIAAGALQTTRGALAAWIADPQTIKPGNNMPMVPLTPDELNAVSAYMANLK